MARDTRKPPKCKYCDAGYAVKSDGCHWIVQSIIPARIKIVKCTRAADLPKEK